MSSTLNRSFKRYSQIIDARRYLPVNQDFYQNHNQSLIPPFRNYYERTSYHPIRGFSTRGSTSLQVLDDNIFDTAMGKEGIRKIQKHNYPHSHLNFICQLPALQYCRIGQFRTRRVKVHSSPNLRQMFFFLLLLVPPIVD